MYDVNSFFEQQLVPYMEQEISDQLQNSIGENMIECIEKIERETEEHKHLIWSKLIERYDPGILREKFRMEYVLQSKSGIEEYKYQDGKVLVIVHMYYPELFGKCVDYLCCVPKEMHKIITTSCVEKKNQIEDWCNKKGLMNYQIHVVENRGREISALLVECRNIIRDYEFLCFVHDKATSGNKGSSKIGSSFMNLLMDNLLKSRIYVENVLNFLVDHPYIGLLAPPAPYHSEYFGNYGNEWTQCFEETNKLSNLLKLHCKMSKQVPPVTVGTAFWCRVKALEALWDYNWTYDFFPTEPLPLDNSINHAIERIFAYVAQHEGYATGIIMNEEFASIQLSNYNYILNGLVKKERETKSFLTYKDYLARDFYYDFANLRYCAMKYDSILIYGTGFFANEISEYLKKYGMKVDGYVVSDGYRNESKYCDRPVFEISEITQDTNMLLIAALKKKDYETVLPMIRDKGIINIYYNGKEMNLL